MLISKGHTYSVTKMDLTSKHTSLGFQYNFCFRNKVYQAIAESRRLYNMFPQNRWFLYLYECNFQSISPVPNDYYNDNTTICLGFKQKHPYLIDNDSHRNTNWENYYLYATMHTYLICQNNTCLVHEYWMTKLRTRTPNAAIIKRTL